jgi:5'-3' exonuclease
MGIHYFFSWFRRNFKVLTIPQNTAYIYMRLTPNNIKRNFIHGCDVLLIDANSLIHNAAQYIYGYGKYKESFRGGNDPSYEKVFTYVGFLLEKLIDETRPSQKVILCFDGVAPYAKQVQQRQRRFKNACGSSDKNNDNIENIENSENDEKSFDPNCITPGTIFMQNLNNALKERIHQNLLYRPSWKELEFVLSDSSVPGEGEAKMMNYMRRYTKKSDTFCMYSPDADMIMLALSLNGFDNLWIIREDHRDVTKRNLIDIGNIRPKLIEKLQWNGEQFHPILAIDDFVFLCFILGNDFLPHIPSLEILQDGIETIISLYKGVCEMANKHILERYHHSKFGPKLRINSLILGDFFEMVTMYEKPILEQKIEKGGYFYDEILESCATFRNNSNYAVEIDITKYRDLYHDTHFNPIEKNQSYQKTQKNLNDAVIEYLCGLELIMNYYKYGIQSWTWYYPYLHAPIAMELTKGLNNYSQRYRNIISKRTKPVEPFIQLMSVLPPQSAKNLLPEILYNCICKKGEFFHDTYCPENPDIFLDGKYNEWEGIVNLPSLNIWDVEKEFNKYKDKLCIEDKNRNKHTNTINFIRVNGIIEEKIDIVI